MASSLQGWLLLLLIAGPVVLGLLAWLVRSPLGRRGVVLLAALLTAGGGVALALTGSDTLVCSPLLRVTGEVLETLLVLALIAIGLRERYGFVVLMGLGQLGILVLEFLQHPAGLAAPAFRVDPLAMVMVVIISVIGSAIVVFALGYMDRHEHHAPSTAAGPGRFFFFLIGFLGLMNGLVLTDSLKCLAFFWEGTTLCSYFLIGHDGTAEARASARRALVINAFGGAVLSLGGALDLRYGGNGSVSGLVAGGAMAPVALLLIATFTKSAQLPFQSWLLGAMVAPTPVSALLHSSTMVKAGSYLVLRLVPAYVNSPLAAVVTVAGGFTFAVASALAIGQSNAKKVLAYSTIANLGLIVALAGINTPLAYAAALMLLIFHALSKALLFLCVGTIEQQIGSRDIDDMSGIFTKMPLTTTIAVVGMLSMMAPPFGMLIGKWMAIAAAGRTPLALVFFVIGSALTILFWGKWMGRIVTTSYRERYAVESLPATMKWVLVALALAVVVGGAAAMPVYHLWTRPIAVASLEGLHQQIDSGRLLDTVDAFLGWPILVVMGGVVAAALASLAGVRRAHVKLPFMCGENVTNGTRSFMFRGPMDEKTTAQAASWYFTEWLSEAGLTRWANLVAVLILLSLIARVLFLWFPG